MKSLSRLLLLMVILSACSTVVDVPATQTAIFSTAFIALQTELSQSTDTPVPPPTVAASAQVESPTPPMKPSASTGSAVLDESFDSLGSDWSEAVWVTSFAPNISKSKMGLEQGWLLFDLVDRSSMLYTFNKKLVEKNVIIETVNQISGPGQTEVAVACRVNSDYSTWVDFRVLYLYEYAIYLYDRSQTTKGLNPFTQLARGSVPRDLLIPGGNNKIKATCVDNQFSIEINDVRIGNAVSDVLVEPGLVGLGGIGAADSSTAVYFDYLKVTKP
jgi:hypothetical protein